ncbi:hypothetical protein TNCV_27981 [Trichonephila clavipes]|uniref:Uncharacterized protein n=1 Tax=Trichonephila clavipes TaxID=2585209 RepID=A0A8X6WK59_TRICX|nr:hypothetical protein TNCV_27981 [Trichonephila clavipes]
MNRTQEAFCTIQVGILGRPDPQSVNPVVIIPIHGGPHNVTNGVVILEVTMIQPAKLPQRRKSVEVKNSGVVIGVEFTMNWYQGSLSISRKGSQTIIPPQPNFTVGRIHSGKRRGIHQTQTLPLGW